jgi:hypothetical protein
MKVNVKRSTVYFDPELHHAIKLKALISNRSLSEIVNEAVRQSLREDEEDIAAFEQRANEPLMTYEELIKDLREHGKI